MIRYVLYVYIAILVIMSFITLLLFIKDKKLAKNNVGKYRIKEKTLLSCISFGGAIGGFFGRIIARHKTNKLYFSFTIYLSILLQLACLGVLIYMGFFI